MLKNWMAESAVQKAERNDFSEVRWLLHLFLWMFNVWFRLQTLLGPASQNHHCPVSLFIVHPWIIFSHFLVYSLIYLNFRMLILYHGSTLFEHLRVWFCCLLFMFGNFGFILWNGVNPDLSVHLASRCPWR